MGFKINSLYLSDGYKVGHQKMLAPGTSRLYGTWIPRSTKHAPKGINKIVSFGQQMVWKWLHDEFKENFFDVKDKNLALEFTNDMSLYLGLEYDGKHFEDLWNLGYLPVRVKSLPEGIETKPNIPHMTFVNTVDGFAWLTLYLETIVSSLAWKPSTSATIAKLYRRQAEEWVNKTDPSNLWLVDYICHDFSARGLSPWDMISSGLGHATSFRGSDTLPIIPTSRYFYNEPEDQVCINSVNASEHSVSTTKIFTVGEQQMISDWLKEFPVGILSIVSDTFDLWELITKYLVALREEIINRNGKLVIRPDSGNPVDIICGLESKYKTYDEYMEYMIAEDKTPNIAEYKGVIELLWDIFGGTINEQGYKVLDSHIGAIYGDSITTDRQVEIYNRLASKGFSSTNIVLGVGSFTYQYNTRDTLGFAAKGSWFEVKLGNSNTSHGFIKEYNIYKDPVTDDGTKKSLKGMLAVHEDPNSFGEYIVKEECTKEEENDGLLETIYEDGKFYNQTTLTKIREKLRII